MILILQKISFLQLPLEQGFRKDLAEPGVNIQQPWVLCTYM